MPRSILVYGEALAQLTEGEAGRALEFALSAAAATVAGSGADPPWRHDL